MLQLGKLDLTSAAGKMILCVLAAMAEMERGRLVERTQSGLAWAQAEGKTLSRPTKTTARDQAKIVELRAAGQSISKTAVQFGIGKVAVHDVVKAARTAARALAPPTSAKPAKAARKAAQAPALYS